MGGLIVAYSGCDLVYFRALTKAYYYLYSRHLSWRLFRPSGDGGVNDRGGSGGLTGIYFAIDHSHWGLCCCFTASALWLLIYFFFFFFIGWLPECLPPPPVGRMTIALVTLMPIVNPWLRHSLTSPDNGIDSSFVSATLSGPLPWEIFPSIVVIFAMAGTKRLTPPPGDWPYWELPWALPASSKYHGVCAGPRSGGGFVWTCSPYSQGLDVAMDPRRPTALHHHPVFPSGTWNSQHDWISFRFQLLMRFDGDGGGSSFSLLQMVGYWLISIAYLFPLLGFPPYGG